MVKKKSTSPEQANAKGHVNIQAGVWRGKKLAVHTHPGLRPIGSRPKEVFFNWIQFELRGRDCLDLFAGSGSLGLEALSRGAASVTLCEFGAPVFSKLQQNVAGLNLEQYRHWYDAEPTIKLERCDSYALVKTRAPKAFNLVFVDPPFMQEKELEVLTDLAANGWLAQQTIVFLQLDAAYAGLVAKLDKRFSQRKFKQLGNILMYLLDFDARRDPKTGRLPASATPEVSSGATDDYGNFDDYEIA